MIFVDSSVWADFFNGYPSPEEIKLKTLIDSKADIAITGIIASEVLSGFKNERTFEEVKKNGMGSGILYADKILFTAEVAEKIFLIKLRVLCALCGASFLFSHDC